jgi:hypothetical protein
MMGWTTYKRIFVVDYDFLVKFELENEILSIWDIDVDYNLGPGRPGAKTGLG